MGYLFACKSNLVCAQISKCDINGIATYTPFGTADNDYLHGFSEQGCENSTVNPAPGVVNFTNPQEDDQRCTTRSINARHLAYYTDLWESGISGEGPAFGINGTGFEEGLFVNRVVGIIESHPIDTPLFVYYAMHLMHSPLCAPKAYLDKFAFITDNEDRRYVSAMTSLLDDAVGDVVTALERSGLWDNTVFVWTSDNGAAIELDTGAKNAWPLKGGYYTDWEGGVRAPALVSGGFLPATQRGRRLGGLIHISDWWPTFVVGLAGGNMTDETATAAGLPPVDGLDQWGYIVGHVPQSPRTEVYFSPFGYDDPSYRSNTRNISNNDSAIIVAMDDGSRIKLITGMIAESGWEGPKYPNGSRPDSAPQGECGADEEGCWNPWDSIEFCTWPPGCTGGSGCKLGCLFNLSAGSDPSFGVIVRFAVQQLIVLSADPTEHNDIASQQPDLASQLHAKLLAFAATLFDPDRGFEDYDGPCRQVEANGGFWGPWLPSSV